MPYGKKYNRKMYKKKNSSTSRLADKKINTLIEKRIQDIARKEDRKNEQYYVETRVQPSTLANPQYTGTSLNEAFQFMIKHDNSTITKSLSSLEYVPLTDFGNNYILNIQPDDAVAKQRNQSLEFRVKQVQAFVNLYNAGDSVLQVSMALIGIPNNNKYTGASSADNNVSKSLRPNRSMLTRNNWKFAPTDSGINAGAYTSNDDQVNIKYHIFDRKTITLAPGATTDPTSNPKREYNVKLGKVFKNPKKLLYNVEATNIDDRSQLMSNYNIYFCWTTNQSSGTSGQNSSIRYNFITGSKFSLGNNVKPLIKASTPL